MIVEAVAAIDPVLALRAGTSVGASPAPAAWTAADYAAEADAAAQIGTTPEALQLVEYSESRLQPWAVAPGGVARGLIQITRGAAKAMGLSDADWQGLSSLSPAAQMPYVVRYFKMAGGGRKSFADAGALYQVVAGPGSLSRGSDNDVVVYPKGSADYAANPGLDADGDGQITVGDLRAHLQRLAVQSQFRNALAELRAVVSTAGAPVIGGGYDAGDPPSPKAPAGVSPASASGGGAVAFALLAALIFGRRAI